MKHSRVRAAIATTLTTSLLTACGGSAGNPQPVLIEDLAHQIETTECEWLVRCHVFSDLPFCERYVEALIASGRGTFNANIRAAMEGRTRYDGAAARACLDTITGTACDELASLSNIIQPTCEKVFTGTVADGGSCVIDVECLPTSFCAVDRSASATSCAGTCTPGGVACNDNGDCLNGKVCDLLAAGTANGTCVTPIPPGALNQPCGTNRLCKAELTCSTNGTGGTCQAKAKLGEICLGSDCAVGLICVAGPGAASGTCMTPVAKGEACTFRMQCGGVLSSTVCDLALQRCVDSPSSGPCIDPSGADCDLLTSYCDTATRTCVPIKALGASCSADSLECGLTGAQCLESPGAAPGVGTCAVAPTCP